MGISSIFFFSINIFGNKLKKVTFVFNCRGDSFFYFMENLRAKTFHYYMSYYLKDLSFKIFPLFYLLKPLHLSRPHLFLNTPTIKDKRVLSFGAKAAAAHILYHHFYQYNFFFLNTKKTATYFSRYNEIFKIKIQPHGKNSLWKCNSVVTPIFF